MKKKVMLVAAAAVLLLVGGCKYFTPPMQLISGARTEIVDAEKVAVKKMDTRRTITITVTRAGQTTVEVIDRKEGGDE